MKREASYRMPAVDVIESPEYVVLVADLPGVDETGVDIETEKNRLTIVGRPAPLENEGRRHLDELETNEFRRDFRLDPALDVEHATATIRDGVLRLEIPRTPKTTPRKIEIT